MMEKRAILAAVLMGAVFLLGQLFLFPTPPATPPVEQAAPAPKGAEAPATKKETAAPTPSSPAPATPAAPRERPPQRLATVETPLYRAVVSSEGGKLQELLLKYRGDKPLVMVGDLGPKGLVAGATAASAQPVPMTLSTDSVKVT